MYISVTLLSFNTVHEILTDTESLKKQKITRRTFCLRVKYNTKLNIN